MLARYFTPFTTLFSVGATNVDHAPGAMAIRQVA
jgi:hypothetical protein